MAKVAIRQKGKQRASSWTMGNSCSIDEKKQNPAGKGTDPTGPSGFVDPSSWESKHIFSHIEWRMNGYLVHLNYPVAEFTWVTEEELKSSTLPTAFKFYQQALEEDIPNQSIPIG